jgi:hypothetical protein
MKRNWLRGIAIALIMLPEPFTTPVGVVLLALSFTFHRKHRDSLKNMELLIRRYRNTMEIGGFNRPSPICKPPELLSPKRNPHTTLLHEYIDRKTRADYQYYYVNDSRRVKDKILHHVLNTEASQYNISPVINNAVPHRLTRVLPPPVDNRFYSGLRPIKPAPQIKIVHHSLRRI